MTKVLKCVLQTCAYRARWRTPRVQTRRNSKLFSLVRFRRVGKTSSGQNVTVDSVCRNTQPQLPPPPDDDSSQDGCLKGPPTKISYTSLFNCMPWALILSSVVWNDWAEFPRCSYAFGASHHSEHSFHIPTFMYMSILSSFLHGPSGANPRSRAEYGQRWWQMPLCCEEYLLPKMEEGTDLPKATSCIFYSRQLPANLQWALVVR